jgi:hypothetical protein
MSLVYPDIKFVGGPTYTDGGAKILFPFTYKNGMLDLPTSSLTAIGTNAPANDGVQVRRLGGDYVVQSVGATLKSYLYGVTNLGGYKIQSAGSIQVSLPGVVTKVQQLSLANLPASINSTSYRVSESTPVTDFLGYSACYVFDKPLVLSASAKVYNDSGSPTRTIYVTLYTSWDH